MRLEETNFNTLFSMRLISHAIEITEEELYPDMYRTNIGAMTKYLGIVKNTKVGSHALVITDKEEKGNMLFAGVVKYHKPETEDALGNWSYEFTMDPEDLKSVTDTHFATNEAFVNVWLKEAKMNNLILEDHDCVHHFMTAFIETLKDFLDTNAVPGEEVTLEFDGYFVATVVVENDEKIISVVPSGDMKRLIKDDSMLED